MLDLFNEVKDLTIELVKIPSIVGKDDGGESHVAEFIYHTYESLDYFKNHPDHLIYQKTWEDQVHRHSCITLIQGNGESDKTIILMGHIDTVGIDDFHELKSYATHPEVLEEKFKEMSLTEDLLEDLNSGDYLFGRGALDMKSGVAGHMALMKYFAEHRDQLKGNLVHIATCDEEEGSRGTICALKILGEWKEKYHLNYIAAINADYSTPLHREDHNRPVYLGTIGKLLPSFYVFGSESHVGHPFSGFDPNLVISELTREIDLNPKYVDDYLGERTMPPVSLKQSDTKTFYDVQTALGAYSYYNFFTHKMTPKDVSEQMKEAGIRAFNKAIRLLNERYKTYCEMNGESYQPLPWKERVFTWEEYVRYLTERHGEAFEISLKEEGEKINLAHPKYDLREFSMALIERMWTLWKMKKSQP